MRVRWVKRGFFWMLQTAMVTGLAWLLLQWNYWDRLSDLVPYPIPTLHHLRMLFVAETLITGALASGIAAIFAARMEQRPLAYAPGVMLCTWVALCAYVFVARFGDDVFEVNTVFMGGRGWGFYCAIVTPWMGVVNGMVSLVVGAGNAAPLREVIFDEGRGAEKRPRRVRLVDAPVVVVAAKEEGFLDGRKAGKPARAKKVRPACKGR